MPKSRERKLSGCHKMSTILTADISTAFRIRLCFKDSAGARYYEVKGLFDDDWELPTEGDISGIERMEKQRWVIFDILTQNVMRITYKAIDSEELKQKFDRVQLMTLVGFCWGVVGKKKA